MRHDPDLHHAPAVRQEPGIHHDPGVAVSGQAVRPDPLKGLRGIFAGTLLMEAILVGLALLVVGRFSGGLDGPPGWYTVGLALGMLVAAFVQQYPWGLGLALTLQVAMVAGWFAHPALGVVGLLFVAVWGYLLYVRSAVLRRSEA